MGLLDDLDGASDAEIQRLMGVVTGERGPRVQRPVRSGVKLGTRPKRAIKWPWEPSFDNLNATIQVTIELPAYMVAAMKEDEYRQAVRDFLDKKGTEWAQPRFRRSMAAVVQDARARFTATFE